MPKIRFTENVQEFTNAYTKNAKDWVHATYLLMEDLLGTTNEDMALEVLRIWLENGENSDAPVVYREGLDIVYTFQYLS